MPENTDTTTFDNTNEAWEDSLNQPALIGDLFDEIQRCASSTQSFDTYFKQSFQKIAKHYSCPYAHLSLQLPTMVIEDYYHQGKTSPSFWKPCTDNAINDAISENTSKASFYNSKTDQTKVTLHTVTLQNAKNQTIGAMSLVVNTQGVDQAKATQNKIKSLAALISLSTGIIESRLATKHNDSKKTLTPNKALINAAKSQNEHELAFTITNNLRNKTQCEQVAISLVDGNKVNMLSISGFDETPDRNPGVLKIKDAMLECLDRLDVIVYQNEKSDWDGDKISSNYFIHKQWHEAAGGAAVASIPLMDDEHCYAILSLRRDNENPFSKEELQNIKEAVEPFGPALELVSHATRKLATHAISSARTSVKTITGPGHLFRKVMFGSAILFSLWFCFGTIEYNITVPSTVQPQKVVHVNSPYEGVIAEAFFKEGDTFQKGDILYRLNTDELQLQATNLKSEIAIRVIQRKQANALKEHAKSQIAGAEILAYQTELAIIKSRINRSSFIAEFNGLIITGDLNKRIGQVVPQGEAFFELAPHDRWELELEIPENVITDVQDGLKTSFMAQAMPDQQIQGEVFQLSVQSEAKNTKNVFTGKASIVNQGKWMRAGMQGVTRIHTGKKPVWWVTFHHLIDSIRMKFWL